MDDSGDLMVKFLELAGGNGPGVVGRGPGDVGSCEMSDELVGKLVDPPGKGEMGRSNGDVEGAEWAAGNVDFLTGSM